MLPYLNKNELKETAILLGKQFPIIPPGNHGNVSACIRFIYGQFDKQGTLRSDQDFERMKNEKPDWTLSREFIWFLFEELRKNNNYYGLCMIHEMEGHRLGDESLINNDKNKLNIMEQNYFLCIEFAKKCNSWKHLFSVYYWAGEYFKKFGDEEKAIKYFKKSILNAEEYYYKYFPNGDQYYSKRLLQSFIYIKNNDKQWKNFYKKSKKILRIFNGRI